MVQIVNYHVEMNGTGIKLDLSVKPSSRTAEANILTIIRQTIAKIEDIEG